MYSELGYFAQSHISGLIKQQRRHVYHLNNYETPSRKVDSCQVWLKSDHACSTKIQLEGFMHDGTTDGDGRQ